MHAATRAYVEKYGERDRRENAALSPAAAPGLCDVLDRFGGAVRAGSAGEVVHRRQGRSLPNEIHAFRYDYNAKVMFDRSRFAPAFGRGRVRLALWMSR
jgi:hypothetical protein